MFKKKDKFLGWVKGNEDELNYIVPAPFDEKHRNEIIRQIVKHDYVICGDTHQSNEFRCVPLFRDGYIMVSMRVWGELMAEAQNMKQEEFQYSYMNFYTANRCMLEEKFPK